MDAYTYLFRDNVFANAQTGNMILFAIHLFEGDWPLSFSYLCPVVFFMLGITTAHSLSVKFDEEKRMHWRQMALVFEIIILCIVGFIGTQFNLLANSMVSFACGIQVQSFRKIAGNNLATTMCIGNIRSATDLFCDYRHTGDRSCLDKSLVYYLIVGVFILGATFGNVMVKMFEQEAILLSPLFLGLAFILMWEMPDH